MIMLNGGNNFDKPNGLLLIPFCCVLVYHQWSQGGNSSKITVLDSYAVFLMENVHAICLILFTQHRICTTPN